MSETQERTHEATPRRKQRAKDEGQTARSALASSALTLLLAPAALGCVAPFLVWWARAFDKTVRLSASLHGDAAASQTALLLHAVAGSRALLPVLAFWSAGIFGTLAAAAACGGIGLAPHALRPRLQQFSPVGVGKRIVSSASLRQALSAALCVACVIACGIPSAGELVAAAAAGASVKVWAFVAYRSLQTFWGTAMAVLALAAAIDIFMQRRTLALKLRMTPREVRDERSQFEGRPEFKARRRALGTARSKALRVSAIRRATAVVTNPAHLAIALRYAPPAIDVPLVVARGADLAAALVRSLAVLHDVPVVEAPELAQMLYAQGSVDRAIPEECYAAVAAVFAWIVRTRGTLRGAEPS